MLSESKHLADFLVEFLGKKPQTLLIPIYSTVKLKPDTLSSMIMFYVQSPEPGEIQLSQGQTPLFLAS